MYCTGCGREYVSEDDSFCRSCGTPKFSSPEVLDDVVVSSPKASIDLKQTTSSLLRKVGKVSLARTTLSKKFPRAQSITQKKFLRELDSPQLANHLQRKFAIEGYEIQTTGTPDDLYIEIGKSGSTKVVSGLLQPITVHVEVDSESTTITLGRAKWGEKATMQKFGSIVFLPLTFSRNYGITQDKMPEKIWGAINQYIDSREEGGIEEIVMEGHGQAVDPKFFGGRKVELGIFEARLESTTQGRPRHLAITGEPGIGKSSMLRKYEQLAKESNCLAVRREFDSTISNVRELSNFLLEALRSECYSRLSKRTETWDKTKDFFRKRSISVTGPGVGSISVGSPSESNAVVLQESFFKEAMRLWIQLNKSEVSCVVFLLDETDELQNVDGGWRFVKSVFTRLAEGGGKFMLVVAGSSDFLKPVSNPPMPGRSEILSSHSPMERFLQPVILKAMNIEEISDVLLKAIAPTGRTLSEEAVKRIFDLSGGEPYLAQNLAFVATNEQSALQPLSRDAIDKAVPAVSENASPFFSERIQYLTDEEKRILFVLSTFQNPASVRELSKKLRVIDPALLTTSLKQLYRSGLVREPEQGQFCLLSELFGNFLRENMGSEIQPSTIKKRK